MTSWYDIYKERMNEGYHSFMTGRYLPFINAILDNEFYHSLELGCGAGNITKALRERSRYKSFTLVDNCPRMLGLAIENNPTDKCNFICADITMHHATIEVREKSIIHSHGVLEHFDDRNISNIIRMAGNYGESQFHYVPSSKYESPSRGDERLLSVDEWYSILKKIDKYQFDISSFNDGFDLIIRARSIR